MARSANLRRFTLQFGSKKYADFGRCKMMKAARCAPGHLLLANPRCGKESTELAKNAM
jgi:hypothetical protein